MSTKPQTIHSLDAGQALTLAPARGQRLRVIAGRLWVTQSGRPDDHFLGAGHSLALDDLGHTVVQAEGGCPARYVMEPAVAAALRVNGERTARQDAPARTRGFTNPSRKPAAA